LLKALATKPYVTHMYHVPHMIYLGQRHTSHVRDVHGSLSMLSRAIGESHITA